MYIAALAVAAIVVVLAASEKFHPRRIQWGKLHMVHIHGKWLF